MCQFVNWFEPALIHDELKIIQSDPEWLATYHEKHQKIVNARAVCQDRRSVQKLYYIH